MPTEPCVMLIFGATGDLTKRLLVPALYNLACDGLLSDRFAVLGTATRQITSEQFCANLSSEDDGIRTFHNRKAFDAKRRRKIPVVSCATILTSLKRSSMWRTCVTS